MSNRAAEMPTPEHSPLSSSSRINALDNTSASSYHDHGLGGESLAASSHRSNEMNDANLLVLTNGKSEPAEPTTIHEPKVEAYQYVRVNVVDGSVAVSTKAKVTVLIIYFFCNLVLTLSNKDILNFVSEETISSRALKHHHT